MSASSGPDPLNRLGSGKIPPATNWVTGFLGGHCSELGKTLHAISDRELRSRVD